MWKKFIGSTLALIIGILSFLGSIARVVSSEPEANSITGAITGVIIILGALAYKSLKKRRLGLVSSTKIRQSMEFSALFLVVVLVVMQRDFFGNLVNDPVPNLIIPIWIFIAYGIVYSKKSTKVN